MEIYYSYVLAAPKNFETSQQIAYDKIVHHGYRNIAGICLCGPTINPMVIMEGPEGFIVVPSEFIASFGGYDDGTARIRQFPLGQNNPHRNQPHDTFMNQVTFPVQYTEFKRKMSSKVCVAMMEPFQNHAMLRQGRYPIYLNNRYESVIASNYNGTARPMGAINGVNMNMFTLVRNTMTLSNIYTVGNQPVVYRVILSSTIEDYPNSQVNDGETQTLNLLYNTNVGRSVVGAVSMLCTANGLALLSKFLEPTNFEIQTDGINYFVRPGIDVRGNLIDMNYFVAHIQSVNKFFEEIVVPHYGNEALSSLGTFSENLYGMQEMIDRFIESHRVFGNHTETLKLMTARNRELQRRFDW